MTASKVAVVLGAGRSMTSGVAKGLDMAGFPMATPGEGMVPASDSNRRGHYEHQRLVDFNDRVLRDVSYAWDDPPPVNDMGLWGDVCDKWADQAAQYLQSRWEATGQFGMKDPRCTVLWPMWELAFRLLADRLDPILVVAHRDADKVAASLARRDNMDPDQALRLVLEYQVRTRIILQGSWLVPRATT